MSPGRERATPRAPGFWLRLIHRTALVPAHDAERVERLMAEANELSAILTASARTASDQS